MIRTKSRGKCLVFWWLVSVLSTSLLAAPDADGRSLHFDGTDDRAVVADVDFPDLSGAWTIEAWVNPDTVAEKSAIFDLTGGSGKHGIDLLILSGGQIEVNTTSGMNPITATGAITAGTWQHVALVANADDPVHKLRLYIDGEFVPFVGSSAIPTGTYSGNFIIGSRGTGATTPVWMHGTIDEVRVWGSARTQAEIQDYQFAEMAVQAAPTPLIRYYSMNDSGQELLDGIGTGHGHLGNSTEEDAADPVRSSASAPFTEAPVATNLNQTGSFTEGDLVVPLISIHVSDPTDGETITATLTLSDPAAGRLTTGTYGSATSTFDSTTGAWAITGSVGDVNAALAAVVLEPETDWDRNVSITTRIRDLANTGPSDGTISFTVTPVNDAPSATHLTQSLTFTEDSGNVALDDIVVTDVDTWDLITVTITSDKPAAGSLTTGTYGAATSTYNAADGIWRVVGSVNDVNASLATVAFVPAANFNGTVILSTRVRDAALTGPADGTITLIGTAVNDAPTDLALSNISVNQSAGTNAVVGTLSTTDPDIGDAHVYTLVDGPGDDANDSFNISGNSLRANNASALAAGSHSVRIQTSDGAATYAKAFTITVVDDVGPAIAISAISGDDRINAAEAGNDLTITGTTSGAEAGRLVTVELNGITFTGTVASNAWSVTFPAAVVGALADQNYTVRADVSDSAGNPATQATRVLTVDKTAPTIDFVSLPGDDTYAIGDTIDFIVIFSENVSVAGTPALGVTMGSATVAAGYVSGSGDMSLLFQYTVTEGDQDTDGITLAASLDLHGGTITDTAGNAAELELPTIGSTDGVLVDGVAPVVQSIVRHDPTDASTDASSVTYRVTFSEDVTGVDLSDFVLTGDGAAGTLTGIEAASGRVYDVAVSSLTGNGTLRLDLEATGTGIIDAAGNAQSAGYTAGETYLLDLTVAFPIAENFNDVDDATLSGRNWLLTGSATTAENTMQLTAALNEQAGSVIYNRPFSSELGVNVQFDYTMGGGTGADGLTFFLIDGAVVSPAAGGAGHALGYAYNGNISPGATLGYLGLAFDRFGNFANSDPSLFHDGRSPALSPNTIAMRGPATIMGSDRDDEEYDYVDASVRDFAVEGDRKVNLTLKADGTATLRISTDDGATWTTVYDDFYFAGTSAYCGYARPATFKLGFAASTGGQNNVHRIDNLLIRKPVDFVTTFTTVPSGTQAVGSTVSYTVTLTNGGPNRDPAARFVYTVPPTLSDVTWTYVLSGTGTGSGNGSGNTIDQTLDLPAGATATFTMSGTITASAVGGTILHSATGVPSAPFGDIDDTNSTATTSTTVYDVPVVTSGSSATGTYGTSFSYSITGTNLPTSFAATGLPAGLSLNTTTGIISGTPAQAGEFEVSLTAGNSGGPSAAVTLTLTIAKADQTITFTAPANQGFGPAPIALTATASSALPVSYTVLSGSATVSGQQLTLTGIGLIELRATQAGDSNFNSAPSVDRSFTVSKGTVTIALANTSQVYTGSGRTVTPTTSPAGVPVQVTYDGSSSAPVNVGSYAITAVAADPRYDGITTGTLTISKASQTIDFSLPENVEIGETIPLTASASSGLEVTFTLVAGDATLDGSSLTVDGPGSIVVRASQAGSDNYVAASVERTIREAAKLEQTITFDPLRSRYTDEQAFDLTATASSGLPVSFTVASGPAMINGNTLTLTGGLGTVVVTASQAGNEIYKAAEPVSQGFEVVARRPQIFFGMLGNEPIAGSILPDGSQGTLIGIIPGTNEAFVVNLGISNDGTWSSTTTTFATQSPAPQGVGARSMNRLSARAHTSRTEPGAGIAGLATVSRTFRGTLQDGVLSGTIDGLDLSFTANVQPPSGVTAHISGYYEASSINSATGATYSVVGTQGRIYVLVITGSTIAGSSGDIAADGSFSVETPQQARIVGNIDAPTTSVTGTILLPNGNVEDFSGVNDSTLRSDRLINLSTRARFTGDPHGTLITGFVIGGSGPKQVLLRGVGPTLAGFDISDPLSDPRLRVFDASGKLIAENDNWGEATGSTDAGAPELVAAMQRVGAFALPESSRDAAVLMTLDPGAYTVHVLDGGESGVAMAEIYDASANPQAEYQRLVNISSRGTVSGGEGVLIGGFIVTGNAPKRILVRGSGPALVAHGVTGILPDPQLLVLDRDGGIVARNDNWETPVTVGDVQVAATAAEITAANTVAGAFQFEEGSSDAALIVTLAPGAYTAQVIGSNNGTGVALIEIYEIGQ